METDNTNSGTSTGLGSPDYTDILQEISDKLYKSQQTSGNETNINPPTIISVLQEIPNNIQQALSKNQFTDKKQFIRYLAAMIFSYSDFEKNSLENLVNKAINYSTALANKLFK